MDKDRFETAFSAFLGAVSIMVLVAAAMGAGSAAAKNFLMAERAAAAAPAQSQPARPIEGALSEQAYHCATALAAYGLAYRHAAGLLELGRVDVPAMLPQDLIRMAGGAERVPEITEEAASTWRTHWESMALTHFYPRLAAEGTPYYADDGRILMEEVSRCRTRFDL